MSKSASLSRRGFLAAGVGATLMFDGRVRVQARTGAP